MFCVQGKSIYNGLYTWNTLSNNISVIKIQDIFMLCNF